MRRIQGRDELNETSADFGEALETYLFHELISYCDYTRKAELSFWRSQSGFEVDFLLNDETAIEVKATKRVVPRHLKGLKALKEERIFKNYVLLSFDSRERIEDGIRIVPLELFLDELWR